MIMVHGAVYYNGILAGHLKKLAPDDYRFTYTSGYMNDTSLPSVSLTLPKKQQEHQNTLLFPFFAGLLSEGVNKDIQCRLLKIDEEDDFTRLLRTAGDDTIGAITVKEIND